MMLQVHYQSCVICGQASDFTLKDTTAPKPANQWKKLDCNHAVHSKCLEQWLKAKELSDIRKFQCPECQSYVSRVVDTVTGVYNAVALTANHYFGSN